MVEERDRDRLLLRIVEAAKENDAGKIVVGLPRSLRGGANAQADKVLEFVGALADAAGIAVYTWDERFTSRMAEAHGTRGKAHDAVAACYMLQNYLDARANMRGEE